MPASEAGAGSPRRVLPIWCPIVAGLLHAALTAIAFPPLGAWPTALVAPLPLIWILTRDARRPLALSAWVTLGILPLHLFEHQWIWQVAALGYVPMAMIVAALTGLFVWIGARAVQRFPGIPLTLVMPVLWTGIEVFRGEVFFTGYPWLLLAHPLIDSPLLAAPAGLMGANGVGFLVALLNGSLADLLWLRRTRPAAAGVALIALTYAVSATLRPAPDSGTRLRIAVVQTNIPQDNKNEWTAQQRYDDFQRFEALTRQAAAGKPDLIVWPETMFPGAALDPAAVSTQRDAIANLGADSGVTYFADRLVALQSEIGIPLMVGAIGVDGLRISRDGERLRATYGALYNSVFLLSGGAVQPERYDKIDLTPFGEVMPYIRHWPWLQRQMMAVAAGGLTFDLNEGHRPASCRVAGVSVITPICFEATKPAACRRLRIAAGAGPCALVNLTNDGWFGPFDAGRWQHLQIARWRAVELNTPVVRAANTGVSAAIDARGRVIKQGVDGSPTPARVDGVLTTDILLGGAPTIYSRTGDVVGWTSLAAAALMLAATFVRVSRKEDA